MSKRIITINRMFGNNGRIIGKALAEELGIKFYDKELIEMASQEKNIPFDEFARVDEKKANQWRFPVDHEIQMNAEYREFDSLGSPNASQSLIRLYFFCQFLILYFHVMLSYVIITMR